MSTSLPTLNAKKVVCVMFGLVRIISRPRGAVWSKLTIPRFSTMPRKELEGLNTLRWALRDLSGRSGLSPTLIPEEIIREYESKDPNELDYNQLEELASCMFTGTYLTQDVSRAISLWEIASKAGSYEAKYCLASCVRDGVGFDENPNVAFMIFESIGSNYPLSYYMMGQMYAKGLGVEKNLTKAFESFKLAIENGVPHAYYRLSQCYELGEGVEVDQDESLKYLEMSSTAGDPSGKHALAFRLYHGIGCLVDRKRAFSLQLDSANAGHVGAMCNVARSYLFGDGVEKNLEEAVKYFEKSYSRGVSIAGLNLAHLYRGKHGHPKNLSQSLSILQKINVNGHFNAYIRQVEQEMRFTKE